METVAINMLLIWYVAFVVCIGISLWANSRLWRENQQLKDEVSLLREHQRDENKVRLTQGG